MRPTLESIVRPGEADKYRAAYASTPIQIRSLFTDEPVALETDGWLVEALIKREPTQLFEIPDWVDNVAGFVQIPNIQCYPSKSLGMWRIHHESSEFYRSSEELRGLCGPSSHFG